MLPTDLRSPGWLLEALRTDIRLRVRPVAGDRPVFIGIDQAADVDAYLQPMATQLRLREVKRKIDVSSDFKLKPRQQ